MSDKVANCSKCNAEIIFMRTKPTFNNPAPKLNPINRLPSENGNLIVDFTTLTYSVVKPKEIEKAKRLGMKLYSSHFANCKSANGFRRR